MDKRFLSPILQKYYQLLEENIKKGHYIETDFRHYSELVRTLVNTAPPENAVFFTGLCLPLFQWFNFKIEPPDATSVSSVSKMETDLIWVEYLKFINELKKKRIKLYRCIFCAEKSVKIEEKFKLVREDVHKTQSEALIIYRENERKPSLELEPFEGRDIVKILQMINISYSCYNSSKPAYLIIDSQDIDSINNMLAGQCEEEDTEYKAEKIRDFFVERFQQGIHHSRKMVFNQSLYKTEIINRDFVEDFFIFGFGDDIDSSKWKFGLCADVVDFKKVRLWMVSDQLDALQKNTTGEYKKRFTFDDIDNFITTVKESWTYL